MNKENLYNSDACQNLKNTQKLLGKILNLLNEKWLNLKKPLSNEELNSLKIEIKHYIKELKKQHKPNNEIDKKIYSLTISHQNIDCFNQQETLKKIKKHCEELNTYCKVQLSNEKFNYFINKITSNYKSIIIYLYISLNIISIYSHLYFIDSINLLPDSIFSKNNISILITSIYMLAIPSILYWLLSAPTNKLIGNPISFALNNLETYKNKIKNRFKKFAFEIFIIVIILLKPIILTIIIYYIISIFKSPIDGYTPIKFVELIKLIPYHLLLFFLIELFSNNKTNDIQNHAKPITFIIILLCLPIIILSLLNNSFNLRMLTYAGLRDHQDKIYVLDEKTYKSMNNDINNLRIKSFTENLKYYKNIYVSCGKIEWKTEDIIVFKPEGSKTYYQIPINSISLFQRKNIFIDNIYKECGNNQE
ncbi:hypothetical protein [Actinobacillus equuli]|uniref:hypothetical protein n=1 Tax=Actinobacillus equuli TaxID=718 RepID=UPI0024414DC8|nr:hypothetical protein [Actinobacillus equuli]WGE58775.1 hypothetical protein NYR73_08750 [Actinobacillus equuli subsp. haemolyticus]WGE60631.1 hypothetical protein NYR74_07940 [Actinobacillus equuli subsp. haemolyticus]